jgi:S-DNA-T family DNA segregation ATPase FtsK/SpoIIIE
VLAVQDRPEQTPLARVRIVVLRGHRRSPSLSTGCGRTNHRATASILPSEISVARAPLHDGARIELGTRLEGRVALAPGQLVRVGDSVLTLERARPSDAAVEPSGEGVLDYNRPPRLLPSEPTAEHRRAFSVIAILAPALMGVVMATVLKNPLYLMFAFMSPVIGIANTVSDRRSGKKVAAAQAAAVRRGAGGCHGEGGGRPSGRTSSSP